MVNESKILTKFQILSVSNFFFVKRIYLRNKFAHYNDDNIIYRHNV
jgi:hypothetical protein